MIWTVSTQHFCSLHRQCRHSSWKMLGRVCHLCQHQIHEHLGLTPVPYSKPPIHLPWHEIQHSLYPQRPPNVKSKRSWQQTDCLHHTPSNIMQHIATVPNFWNTHSPIPTPQKWSKGNHPIPWHVCPYSMLLPTHTQSCLLPSPSWPSHTEGNILLANLTNFHTFLPNFPYQLLQDHNTCPAPPIYKPPMPRATWVVGRGGGQAGCGE